MEVGVKADALQAAKTARSEAVVSSCILLLRPTIYLSADDLEREPRRAAALYQLGERVPVNEVGERLGDSVRQAETQQLFCAPSANEELLVGFDIELIGEQQDRFHLSVLLSERDQAEQSPLRRALSSRPARIQASG